MRRSFVLLVLFLSSFLFYNTAYSLQEVVWAVNCGGDSVVDSHGIRYQKDFLSVGTPSDYGKSMMIGRVVPQDQILYQTERYHTTNFAYDIPIPGDGEYVLWLKFSEVWFTAPNQKVFDVVLNGEHTIVERLDVFSKVGRGVAHDEIIPLKVKDGKLFVNGESSDLYYNKISVEFIKGDHDNPKANAIVLMRGTPDGIPKLAPLEIDESLNPPPPMDDFNTGSNPEEQEQPDRSKQRKRPVSGPKAADPYATDDTSTMLLPVLIAIGAFLPILFCLCKL